MLNSVIAAAMRGVVNLASASTDLGGQPHAESPDVHVSVRCLATSLAQHNQKLPSARRTEES
jgi:hypothetical protein